MTTAYASIDKTSGTAKLGTLSLLPDAHAGTVATRVWLNEYAWLETLYNDAANCSPKLRYPDLISACVSLVFDGLQPELRIFAFLHTRLVLRDQETVRRQEAMWREQYELLLTLQRSGYNSHPNPQFKLDHFTTACVALVMEEDNAKARLFDQARRNIAARCTPVALK